MTDPAPWPITAVESRGGTWLRITHADGTVADHDLAHLIGRGGVFAGFTSGTIADAQAIDGAVGWIIGGETVDLAPDALWEHTRGRCGGGGCTGWSPDQTVVVALPTGSIVDQIVAAWSRLAPDTSALGGVTWLREPGGRDWAALLLTERHRAEVGAAVPAILQRTLPLTVAGLCVRDIIRECNEQFAPIALRAAAAAAAGETYDVAAAVAESEPFLRERISQAVARAVRRG